MQKAKWNGSEGSRLAYLKKEQERISAIIHSLDNNRKLRARLTTAGTLYDRRRYNERLQAAEKFSLSPDRVDPELDFLLYPLPEATGKPVKSRNVLGKRMEIHYESLVEKH